MLCCCEAQCNVKLFRENECIISILNYRHMQEKQKVSTCSFSSNVLVLGHK